MSPFSFALMINLYIFVLVCVASRSVMSDSLRPHRLQPIRGFSAHGNSADKNTGVGSLSLLQEIFPTQGFPGGSACKESTCSAGDPGSIPGLE